jgi:hypothetical protein
MYSSYKILSAIDNTRVLEYSSTGIALYNCILHFTLQLHSTLLFVYLSKHELHLLRYHEFLYRKTILKSSLHY